MKGIEEIDVEVDLEGFLAGLDAVIKEQLEKIYEKHEGIGDVYQLHEYILNLSRSAAKHVEDIGCLIESLERERYLVSSQLKLEHERDIEVLRKEISLLKARIGAD